MIAVIISKILDILLLLLLAEGWFYFFDAGIDESPYHMDYQYFLAMYSRDPENWYTYHPFRVRDLSTCRWYTFSFWQGIKYQFLKKSVWKVEFPEVSL